MNRAEQHELLDEMIERMEQQIVRNKVTLTHIRRQEAGRTYDNLTYESEHGEPMV